MDYRGRGSGVKKGMGKERARGTGGLKQEERVVDSKPITIGLEKTFHPKTVTTHANLPTSTFLCCLSPAYKYSIHTHTHGQTSRFITHSHT